MSAKKANPFGGVVTSRSRSKGAEGAPPKPARGHTAKRSAPVRVTVDLDPADYSAMRRTVLEIAEAADRPTLTHTAVWRALLAEVAEDEELAGRVADRVRRSQ